MDCEKHAIPSKWLDFSTFEAEMGAAFIKATSSGKVFLTRKTKHLPHSNTNSYWQNRDKVSVFLSKCTVLENGCWSWCAAKTKKGYAQFKWSEGNLAHRFAYKHIGKMDLNPNLTLDHLCRKRDCVNPKHLEQVTLLENISRGNCASAVNKRKTHCKEGHVFSPDNTYFINRSYGNERVCRICDLSRKKKIWKNKK